MKKIYVLLSVCILGYIAPYVLQWWASRNPEQ